MFELWETEISYVEGLDLIYSVSNVGYVSIVALILF